MITPKLLFIGLIGYALSGQIIVGMDQKPQSPLFSHHKLEAFDQTANNVDVKERNVRWQDRGQQLLHGCSVHSVAYHPNGSRLVTAGDDGKVRLWNLIENTATTLADYNQSVSKVCFAPEGKHIAVGIKQGTVFVIDMPSKEVIREYDVDTKIGSLLFHPSLKNVLCIALNSHNFLKMHDVLQRSNDEVLIEDILSGQTIARLKPCQKLHGSDISAVAVHPQGALFLVAYWYKKLGKDVTKIAVYDDAWQKIGKLKIKELINVLAFQPQGKLLAAGCSKGKVGLWDLDGKKIPVLRHWRCSLGKLYPLNRNECVDDIKFHPHKDLVAIASGWGYIEIKDFQGNTLVKLIQSAHIQEIAFTPDGTSLVAVGSHMLQADNAEVIIWQ